MDQIQEDILKAVEYIKRHPAYYSINGDITNFKKMLTRIKNNYKDKKNPIEIFKNCKLHLDYLDSPIELFEPEEHLKKFFYDSSTVNFFLTRYNLTAQEFLKKTNKKCKNNAIIFQNRIVNKNNFKINLEGKTEYRPEKNKEPLRTFRCVCGVPIENIKILKYKKKYYFIGNECINNLKYIELLPGLKNKVNLRSFLNTYEKHQKESIKSFKCACCKKKATTKKNDNISLKWCRRCISSFKNEIKNSQDEIIKKDFKKYYDFNKLLRLDKINIALILSKKFYYRHNDETKKLFFRNMRLFVMEDLVLKKN